MAFDTPNGTRGARSGCGRPGFARYERITDREIPVILLTPRARMEGDVKEPG